MPASLSNITLKRAVLAGGVRCGQLFDFSQQFDRNRQTDRQKVSVNRKGNPHNMHICPHANYKRTTRARPKNYLSMRARGTA